MVFIISSLQSSNSLLTRPSSSSSAIVSCSTI